MGKNVHDYSLVTPTDGLLDLVILVALVSNLQTFLLQYECFT